MEYNSDIQFHDNKESTLDQQQVFDKCHIAKKEALTSLHLLIALVVNILIVKSQKALVFNVLFFHTIKI